MLCTVRVHRVDDQDGEVFPLQLKIIARNQGEAAAESMQDTAGFPSVAALLDMLRTLKMEEFLVLQAEGILNDEAQLKVGQAIQVDQHLPEALLQQAGFYLHRQDDPGPTVL